MLEGEVFNISEIRRGLTDGASSETETLLKMYFKHGVDFLRHLNGEFTIVIYDEESHRLTICMDHAASHPMYFMKTDEGLLFGAEKKLLMTLTSKRFEVNPIGLLQFVSHIHNVGDVTFIRNMHRMQPGQYLTSTGRNYSTRSMDLLPLDGDTRASAGDAIEEWSENLSQATARRLADDQSVLISLSAGLDSRAISCSIDRGRRPIHARTWGTPQSTEVRYASKIAKHLKFEHILENPEGTQYSRALHAIVWRTEGESPCTNAVSIFGHPGVMEKCTHIAGGWLGDASSGAHLRPFMFLPRSRQAFIEKIFNWYVVYPDDQLKTVFAESFVNKYSERVKFEFHRSFDRFETCENTKAYEFWDLFNRQARMTTGSMPVDSHLFGKVRPFYDREYLDFVMALPPKWRFGQSFYRAVINRIGPEIQQIPDSNTDFALKAEPWWNLTDYLLARRHNAYRRIGKKFGKTYQNKRLTPAQDKSEAIRKDTEMRSTIEWYLGSEYFDDSIFSRSGIKDVLASHYSNLRDHADLIVRLATLLVALRYFVYERPRSCPDEANPLDVGPK
jgi:hypothetical protein